MRSSDRPGAKSRTVEDLANDLLLAQEVRPEPAPRRKSRRAQISERPGRRGRAVFLVGAGCSKSADIPLAPEIAQQATQILHERYLGPPPENVEIEPKIALAELIRAGKIPERYQRPDQEGDWEALYPYLFSDHLKHPNHQREIIASLAGRRGALNWAHACLGELVSRKYVHTVLTTNFDQLVLQGIIRTGIIPVVADGLESLSRIDPSPRTPQVVHLHGSMHTYDLRNSPMAVLETSSDENLKSTMHGLLRQSTVLVVVGYRGGEEGIMDLVQNAVDNFKRMVIYWVAYEKDYRSLSPRARALIESGENAFFVIDQDADMFFQRLMREMKIGQPSWVEDPLKALSIEGKELSAIEGDDEIGGLVAEYRDRINYADAHRETKDNRLIQALQARSRGAFREAIEFLTEIATGKNYRSRRLLAQSWRDLFYDEEGSDRADIEAAIKEFRALADLGANPHRFADFCSFIEAVWDLHDKNASSPLSDEDVDRLEEILRLIENQEESGDVTLQQSAKLNLYKARVAQELSEKVKGGHGNPEMREQVLSAFRTAWTALKGELNDRAREAEDGYAVALVADAEFRLNEGRLEDADRAILRERLNTAIQMHSELAEFARYNATSRNWAGYLANLASANLQLVALERDLSEVAHQNAAREAVRALVESAAAYIEAGDELAASQEIARRVEVEQELVR